MSGKYPDFNNVTTLSHSENAYIYGDFSTVIQNVPGRFLVY